MSTFVTVIVVLVLIVAWCLAATWYEHSLYIDDEDDDGF